MKAHRTSLSRRYFWLQKSAVSVVLALAVLSQASLADAAQASVWSERQVRPAAPASDVSSLRLPPLTLRADGGTAHASGVSAVDRAVAAATALGARVAVKKAASRRTLVLIQDIHANPEAQKNIQKLAAAFAGAGLSILALEGTEGRKDLSAFRLFPDRDSLAVAVRYFVGQGTLSGAAASAFLSPAIDVIGVDDSSLHERNVAAFLRSRDGKDRLVAALDARRASLDAEPVSPALRAFDQSLRAYHAGRRPIGDQLETLTRAAGARPMTSAFLRTLSLERSIDAAAVERERSAALARLADKVSAEQAQALLAAAASFRAGRSTAAEFYALFESVARKAGAPLDRSPALRRYVDYVIACDQLNADQLFAEMAEMEDRGYDALGAGSRAWVARSRFLDLAARLTDFSLSHRDWKAYRALASSTDVAPLRKALGEDMTPFEDFYRAATLRDDALAARLSAAVSTEKIDFAAAVAGGFHVESLAEKMNRAGWNIVTVTPRLTAADASRASAYLSFFAREKTPLDRLFSPERLFVSPDPFAAASKLPMATAAVSVYRRLGDAASVLRSLAPRVPLGDISARRRAASAEVAMVSGGRRLSVVADFHPDGEIASLRERDENADFLRGVFERARAAARDRMVIAVLFGIGAAILWANDPTYSAAVVMAGMIRSQPSRKRTVLYIEDDADTRETLKMILRMAGYEVLTAGLASEGLNLLSKYRDDIDVVISDFDLPDMNGDHIYRDLRADPRNAGIRFIFLSGRSRDSIDRSGIPADVKSFTKPGDPKAIVDAVSEAVDARRAEETPHDAPATRATILYIEDEPALRGMFTMMMEAEGFEVLAAGTPDEALNYFRTRGGDINLVVSDVDLNADKNGPDIYKIAQADPALSKIPYLMMTSRQRDEISRMGVADTVPLVLKPTTFEAFFGELNKFFPKSAGEPTMAPPPAVAVEKPKPPEIPLLTEKKILLVDESPMVRLLVTKTMERRGVRVEATASPSEALALLTLIPDDYGAVVSEVTLPEMSGVEFYRKVQGIAQAKDIPFIFAGTSDATEAREAGVPADVRYIDRGSSSPEDQWRVIGSALGVIPLLLYVEDSDDVRSVMTRAFIEAGFDVVAVANGEEAAAMIEELGDRITGVVSDFDLPLWGERPFNGDAVYAMVKADPRLTNRPFAFLSSRTEPAKTAPPGVPWFTKSVNWSERAARIKEVIAPAPVATALIAWLWSAVVPLLKARGWSDRAIASLGGAEELVFSALLTSGGAALLHMAAGVDPVTAVLVTAAASLILFVAAHLGGLMAWRNGALVRAPPAPSALAQVIGLGVGVRLLYVPLLLLLPFGTLNIAAALPAAIVLHAVYNAVVAPLIHGGSGMIARETPAEAGRRRQQNAARLLVAGFYPTNPFFEPALRMTQLIEATIQKRAGALGWQSVLADDRDPRFRGMAGGVMKGDYPYDPTGAFWASLTREELTEMVFDAELALDVSRRGEFLQAIDALFAVPSENPGAVTLTMSRAEYEAILPILAAAGIAAPQAKEAPRATGLIGWLWSTLIPRLKSRGWSDRTIAALGGAEELVFSAILTSGAAALLQSAAGLEPVTALVISASASLLLFVAAHLGGLMAWRNGALERAPPSRSMLAQILGLGIGVRLLYLPLIVFLPYGALNAAIAIPAAVLLHAVYNALVAPLVGGAAGLPANEEDAFNLLRFASRAAAVMASRSRGKAPNPRSNKFVPEPPQAIFLGGANGIGTSSTLLTIGGADVIVDAGLNFRSGDPLPRFDLITRAPAAIVITHAHTDHIGALPILWKRFPNVPIYASAGTIQLMRAMLPGSLQTLRQYGITGGDIEDTLRSIIPLESNVRYRLNDQAWMRFIDAGHILGARSVEFGSLGGHAFISGDVGWQPQITVGRAEVPSPGADLFIVESTQGDRETPARSDEEVRFIQICRDAIARGGSLIIPSLALARSQEILLLLRDAQAAGDPVLKDVEIVFDGMINSTNRAFTDAAAYLPEARRKIVEETGGLYRGENVRIRGVRDFERERIRDTLNDAEGKPMIVVAPAGMLNGGHILDYIEAGMENPKNAIVFVNYQPTGGLGLQISEAKAKGTAIRIDGQWHKVNAALESVSLSGHASGPDLETYIALSQPQPGGVVLVHGHPNGIAGLAARPKVAALSPVAPNPGDRIQAAVSPLATSLGRLLDWITTARVDLPTTPLLAGVAAPATTKVRAPPSRRGRGAAQPARPSKKPVKAPRPAVPIAAGELAVMRVGSDLGIGISIGDVNGVPSGFVAHRRVWENKTSKDRREIPFALGSSDGIPVEILGSVPELIDADPKVTAARFRAFTEAASALLGGSPRHLWLAVQALAGGRTQSIADMAQAFLSEEGEAALGLRRHWDAVLRPAMARPGGPDAIEAHNSLAALVRDRVDVAVRVAIALRMQQPADDRFFSVDPETGLHVPTNAADLISTYGESADELNREIAIYALPIGSEVTIPAGHQLNLWIAGQREKVEFADPISARLDGKSGQYVTITVMFNDGPISTFTNFRNIRLPNLDEGPQDEGTTAAIPAFAAAFAAVAGLVSNAPNADLRRFYKRWIAWFVESPVAPGLGGFLLSLAFGAAGYNGPAAFFIAQAAVGLLFVAVHTEGRGAAFGLAAAGVLMSGGFGGSVGAVIAATVVLALAHAAINLAATAPEPVTNGEPDGKDPSRRQFLIGVSRLAVQVAAAGPMARAAQTLSSLPGTAATAAPAASLSGEATAAFYDLVSGEGLLNPVLAAISQPAMASLPAEVQAAETALRNASLAGISPERLQAVRQLASLWHSAEIRGLTSETLLREARGIVRRLAVRATAAQGTSAPPKAAPAPAPANPAPGVDIPLAPATPAAESPTTPADFFAVTDAAGVTSLVIAAILVAQIRVAQNGDQEGWVQESSYALDAATPRLRDLAVALAQLWIEFSETMSREQLALQAEAIVRNAAEDEDGTEQIEIAASPQELAAAYPFEPVQPLRPAGTKEATLQELEYSDLTSRSFLRIVDLPFLKAWVRRIGIGDDVMTDALRRMDTAEYRRIVLDAHPYTARAAAEIDRFFSVYTYHDGTYYVLRELRRAGLLPAKTILVNVDPHSDMAQADSTRVPLTAGSWIGHALRDGLVSWYLQIDYTKDDVKYLTWSVDPDSGEIVITPVSPERAGDLLAGRPVLLTVDADAFSLRQSLGEDHQEYTLDPAGIRSRLADVEKVVSRGKTVRVVGAISPDYLQQTQPEEQLYNEAWVADWRKATEEMAGRLPRAEPLGVSLLLGNLYSSARSPTLKAFIAFFGAPIVETLALGALYLVLSPTGLLQATAFVAGASLLFVAAHPRVFRGVSTVPQKPRAGDYGRLLAQGICYAFAFVFVPLFVADPSAAFWIAAAEAAVLHAFYNLQAAVTGKTMGMAALPSDDEVAENRARMDVTAEVDVLKSLLLETAAVRRSLTIHGKRSVESYRLANALEEFAAFLILGNHRLNRATMRAWLADSDAATYLSARERSRLVREITTGAGRESLGFIFRRAASALTVRRLGLAFLERNAARFADERRRFEERFGGRVILVSADLKSRWFDEPIVRMDGFEKVVRSVADRVPAGFPPVTRRTEKIMRTILASAADASGGVGLLMIEPDHREDIPSLAGRAARRVAGEIRLTTVNLDWGQSPATRANATGYGRQTNSYKGPAMHHFGEFTGTEINVYAPADAIPARAGDVLTRLDGGSNSTVERVASDSNGTLVVKTAPAMGDDRASGIPPAEAMRKLVGEATVMRRLYGEGYRFLPEILQVDEAADRVAVTMEDLDNRGFVPAASLFFFDYHRHVTPGSIWELALSVLHELSGAMYSRSEEPTPREFVENSRIEHVRRRVRQAAEKAPSLTALFDAPVVIVRGMHSAGAVPGFETMVPFILATAHILTPPSLRPLMGDLHFGNLMVDPIEYDLLGRFVSFRLLDFNDRANDFVYDLAKIIHSFYGRYEIIRMEELYGFVNEGSFEVEGGSVPIYDEWLNDEETNPIPLSVTDDLTDIFLEWLREADDLLGLEHGSAWKARLLFTHAIIMLGLAPFHLANDGTERRATGLYVTGLELLAEALDLTINGAFDAGMPAALPRVSPAVRDAWNSIYDGFRRRSPEERPTDLKTYRFERSRIDQVRKYLADGDQRRAAGVLRLFDGLDTGHGYAHSYNLLGRYLSPEEMDLYIRAVMATKLVGGPAEIAAEQGLSSFRERTQPARTDKPAFVTVTLNPIVDATERGNFDRDEAVTLFAGGKGQNMARALKAWTGRDPISLGIIGGDTGLLHAALSEKDGVPSGQMTVSRQATRLSMAVAEYGRAGDRFAGASPVIPTSALKAFRRSFDRNIRSGDIVMLAGSLPKGVPAGEYARMIRIARTAGAKVYVDTKGDALRQAVAQNPHFVGVNIEEFAEAVGVSAATIEGDLPAIAALASTWVAAGIDEVVITLGGDGLLLISEEEGRMRAWHARSPRVRVVDTSGAGDTVKSAFAYGESVGMNRVDALRLAAAAGAVTVSKSGIGMSSLEEARALAPSVEISPVSPPVAAPAPATLAERYDAIVPLELGNGIDPNGDLMAGFFSEYTVIDRVDNEVGLTQLKSVAHAAGVADDAVRTALASPSAYRELALSIHPYAVRAARERRFVTIHKLHEGAYYEIRQMRMDGRLPPNAVLINVDPHSDFYQRGKDQKVNDVNWVANALDDGLIGAYVQMRIDSGAVVLRRPAANAPPGVGAMEPTDEIDLRQLLTDGRPVFLTIDADAFSLGGTQTTSPYHMDQGRVAEGFRLIESFLDRFGIRPVAVNGAISPAYLGDEANQDWVNGWAAQLESFGARVHIRNRLGISFLLGRLYSEAKTAGQAKLVAFVLAPLLETLLIGGLFGLWAPFLGMPLSVAIVPIASGLFYVLMHPRLYMGGRKDSIQPRRSDRIGLFAEGALYGLLFVLGPLTGTDHGWLSGFIAGTLAHAAFNKISWDLREPLGVGGAEAPEASAARRFVDGLLAARSGRAPDAVAALGGLLDGAPVTLNIETIDGRLAALEAAAKNDRFSEEQFVAAVRAELLRRVGRDLSVDEIRLAIQRWSTMGTASAAATPGSASLVLLDSTMGDRLAENVLNAVAAAGDGGIVLFAADSPETAAAAQKALGRVPPGVTIETRPELFHAAGDAIRVSLAELSAGVATSAALGGRRLSRIVVSDRVTLDSAGLDAGDPLRAAVYVILSALGPVSVTAGQLDRIGALATLVASQA